jgi:hypothetical protein
MADGGKWLIRSVGGGQIGSAMADRRFADQEAPAILPSCDCFPDLRQCGAVRSQPGMHVRGAGSLVYQHPPA